MNYKTEHPDFTLPEGITIPDGFVDTSRSNHLCPNWTDYNNNIVLFIDYEDGEMGARFTLNFDSLDQDGMVSDQWQDWNDIEICDNPLCCFRSNHWKAILKAISKQPNRKEITMKNVKISNLDEGQTIWFFTKYGELLEGDIFRLTPKEVNPTDPTQDEVSVKVIKTDKTTCTRYGIRIESVHTEKPSQGDFVSNEVDFESECSCGGTIHGTGFADDDGEILSFNYQECSKCGWNQYS